MADLLVVRCVYHPISKPSLADLSTVYHLVTANDFFSFSSEPGYYKENDFGIRIEDIAMLTPIKTKVKLFIF